MVVAAIFGFIGGILFSYILGRGVRTINKKNKVPNRAQRRMNRW